MTTVMGLDVGGSSTVLAVRSDREETLRLHGPGANPRSSGGQPVEVISQLLDELSGRISLAAFNGTHIGMAGYTGKECVRIAEDFEKLWLAKGLTHPPTVSSDLEIAYCSARSSFPGLLLLAGTGAVACRIDTAAGSRFSPRIAAQVDGWGWKLGDCGSGLDIGWRATRHLARALDGRESWSPLADLLLEHLGLGGQEIKDELLALADSTSMAYLATLAPVVFAAAGQGDQNGLHIVDTAAKALVDKLTLLIDEHIDEVVLAGSILTQDTPVAARVSAMLRRLGIAVFTARDPVVGALQIASTTLRGSS